MTPLRIVAKMAHPFVARHKWVAFDGLLASVVARMDGLPPPLDEADIERVEIPVKLSECGRYHLASFSISEVDANETVHMHRRPPIAEAQAMGGPKVRTINIASGSMKAMRQPVLQAHSERLIWYCIGDAKKIRDLLVYVTNIGALRAHGRGRVAKWSVDAVEPWGEGFPVVGPNGHPHRALPADVAVADGVMSDMGRVTYPYWLSIGHERRWTP